MNRNRSGIGSGLLLITIGVIFLSDRQGWGGFGNFWPVILIVLGASKLFFRDDSAAMNVGGMTGRRGCRRENRFGGLWLIMVGGIFLLHQNHIMRINQSWPLFIVAGGLGIVFSGIFDRKEADTKPAGPMGGGGQLS